MPITWSIFPKFYRHLSIAELAALIAHVGLDTTDAVIRDGYWVTESHIRDTLPTFVRQMAAAGINVRFATTGYMPDSLDQDETPLAVLADNGIAEFRMGYFRWDKSKSPAQCLDDARRQMQSLAHRCVKRSIRAVYQVHHGTLIANPWSAWQLVHDLPARHVGVMLDPGNQVHEGWENWHLSTQLLGPHLVAMGIKDGGVYRDPEPTGEAKGWRRRLGITLNEGIVNWHEVVRALRAAKFAGWFDFMPFYDETDPDAMTAKLKHEVAYLRRVMETVAAEAH